LKETNNVSKIGATTMDKSKIIPAVWDIPKVFHARLGDRAGRQRAMFEEGHLLLILHEPPQPDEPTRKGRLFWRKPNGDWSSTTQGRGLLSLQNHLSDFTTVIDQYDHLEDEATTADQYFSVIEKVLPLKRATQNLLLVLEEARKLVPDDRDLINLRDQAYDLSRTAELLYEGAKNGLDLAQTKRAEDQARSSHEMASSAHRLNLLVSFFFPLATLTALFGMQLDSGLEKFQPPLPFLTVLTVAIVAGIIISLVIGSKPKTQSGS
jgi:hypothetical protein